MPALTMALPIDEAGPIDFREYAIGWLSALPIELAAAQLLLDETHGDLPQDPNNDTQYTLGRCLSAGQLRIGSAATVAIRMRAKFPNLRFGLMVGVGGRVLGNEDVRLGDVVVSQPSRHLRNNTNIPTYLAIIKSRTSFRRPKSKLDILFKPTYDYIEGEKTCRKCDTSKTVTREPREHNRVVVHYGTIASGNCVIKNARERDLVSSEFGGVLCFEMEAAGLVNSWPCLVIRGICNYADSHKNEKWQSYAAATAAAYAKDVLSVIPTTEVATIHTINEVILSDGNIKIRA
ncbi:nucleoside phosphorylase domain-containing protein [Phaeosphaeriaceae sp. PMI808]|nr:nucleoside phosphorylase domain-containing protein [Phaeosphaeriaceae sp. PMI808]